ncbi:E3 ubiquitin-protein ligase RNF31 isoform X2 [Lissotriton helveticus]
MDARTLFLEKRVSLLSTLCVNPAEVDTDALHALLEIVLPLEEKYQELNAVGIILTNAIGEPNIYLRKISTSFNILEKYGRNLLNPQKPKYWRSVKFNNPVFKTTVDAMKGGRDILRLYGYTEEQPDGMSFCDEVEEPDTYKVASVTLEVTLLRLELNLLIAGTHPHPEIFQELLPESSFSKSTLAVDPFQTQDKSRQADQQIPSDQHNPQSAGSLGSCGLCGEQDTSIHCPTCQLSLCVECDGRFHKHPSRANHQRVKDAAPGPSSLSPRTLMGSPPVMSPLPLKTLPGPSTLYQAPGAPLPPSGSSYFPGGLAAPNRSPGTWKSLSTPAPAPTASITTSRPPWRCTCCTTMNEGRSVLCVGCDRPRGCKTAPAPEPEGKSLGRGSWCCQACTFENEGTAVLCVVCERPRLAGKPSLTVPEPPPQPLESSQLVTAPKEMYGWDCERCTFWNTMPSSVCEMCNRTRAHGDNNQAQQEEEELKIGNRPDHLDVVSGKQEFNRQQKLRDDGAKLIKMIRIKEIEDLGFRDKDQILQSLYISAGDVGRTVTELQRHLLEPFHTRLWQEHEPELCFDTTDKQSLVRRILAVFSLPSWGRAELVVHLMQEPERRCELQDIVEAVQQSHDKEFIKRMLTQQCAVCYDELPRSKMQSLTSCECTICPECFKLHFTIAVKEKHIKDMVCPECSEPEINDEGELLSYFSTLDILLRDCLDHDVLDLFHKKLTERTLMKDPKFLWCTHCSFGFIYEREQMEARCPQCQKSFCIKCKRPWEVQHQGISCEEFLNWKRENDPEYQAQGLAMYLQENGIDCPHCKFSYALARGGCMHFICSQCRHQFCSGCYNTFFHNNNKCTDASCLVKMTLHAHHPRDCLFYLRDWDVVRLQKLLQDNNVVFNTDPPTGTQTAPGGGCRVLEQKEGVDRLKDEPCGKVTEAGNAGLCESHYKEYLVRLINNHTLDPATLYDLNELLIAYSRYLPPGAPQKAPAEDDQIYYARLLRKLTTDVPLGERIPRKPQ